MTTHAVDDEFPMSVCCPQQCIMAAGRLWRSDIALATGDGLVTSWPFLGDVVSSSDGGVVLLPSP